MNKGGLTAAFFLSKTWKRGRIEMIRPLLFGRWIKG